MTLTSLAGFGSIIVIRKGVLNLLVCLAIGLPFGLVLGYRNYRKTGKV